MELNKEAINEIYNKTDIFHRSLLMLTKKTKKRFSQISIDQIKYLQNKAKSESFRFYYTYLATQLYSLWTDLEFIDHCLKFVEPKYVIVAARMFYERSTRIQYVLSLDVNKGNELCKEEFPRALARYYEDAVNEGIDEIKSSFENDCQRLYGLDIKEYKPKKGELFLNMKDRLKKIYPKEADALYLFYKDFSEFTHGNVPINFIASNNYNNFVFIVLGNLVDTISGVDLIINGVQTIEKEIKWYRNRINKLIPPVLDSELSRLFSPQI